MPIALALSGGGIRAMVFHLGVLKHLAERGLLENVAKISTVSGGSLLVGLLLKHNDHRWPSSEQFLAQCLPQLRIALCARSLQLDVARQLLNPRNWKFLLSRANLLALALQNEWQVHAVLSDLPIAPDWAINATTAESGKRFRFKRADMGDYTFGYTQVKDFPLATALAVSAAIPGGLGPLALDKSLFSWRGTDWSFNADSAIRRLHLYDGGVYDNLGLEPFFDVGTQLPKVSNSFILCSDAGAPLEAGFDLGPLNIFRLKRVADIMSDQSKTLRVRAFVHYLKGSPKAGAYLAIKAPDNSKEGNSSARFAWSFPTTLRRLNPKEFDLLSDHGQRVAEQVREEFGLYDEDPPSS
jgi:NTE family protein